MSDDTEVDMTGFDADGQQMCRIGTWVVHGSFDRFRTTYEPEVGNDIGNSVVGLFARGAKSVIIRASSNRGDREG